MPGFNLTQASSTISAEDDGTVVHLRDAAGDPMTFGAGQPVTLTIAGTDSTCFRRAEAAFNAKLGKRLTQRDAAECHAARPHGAQCT